MNEFSEVQPCLPHRQSDTTFSRNLISTSSEAVRDCIMQLAIRCENCAASTHNRPRAQPSSPNLRMNAVAFDFSLVLLPSSFLRPFLLLARVSKQLFVWGQLKSEFERNTRNLFPFLSLPFLLSLLSLSSSSLPLFLLSSFSFFQDWAETGAKNFSKKTSLRHRPRRICNV